MTHYNEEQAVANHTEKCHQLSRAQTAIQRRDKRIKDLQGMVVFLQNRVADLEEQASARAQAERYFGS